MKKIFVIFSSFILLSAGFIFAKQLWRGTVMNPSKVCKKWGEQEFNAAQFKAGSPDVRAQMSCAILKNQQAFLGKDISEIRTMLGDHDGYYFSDVYPAYLIEVGKNHDEDTWQLVFMMDYKESIKEVIVHKNCCN